MTNAEVTDQAKPLIKWPGGKRFLAPQLVTLISNVRYREYLEPFAGGAAVFFRLHPKRARLSDTNADLINLYSVTKTAPAELIRELRKLRNSENDYYDVRSWRPRNTITRAARLYYLMRFSFNGIYRENLAGVFNVPYGHKLSDTVVDEHQLWLAHKALQVADLACADFRSTASSARKGDLVYFDPPYTVRHNNNGFIKYNRQLFSWQDQLDLAALVETLSKRGCYVIVSNANHRDIAGLYSGCLQLVVSRSSTISGQAHGRAQTTERLILSRTFPL